jgi:hypothetical protein
MRVVGTERLECIIITSRHPTADYTVTHSYALSIAALKRFGVLPDWTSKWCFISYSATVGRILGRLRNMKALMMHGVLCWLTMDMVHS